MNLRKCIPMKVSSATEQEDFESIAVSVFEKNANTLYKNKSMTWNLRVTADELGIRKDELCEILEKYYDKADVKEEE